MLEGVSVCNIRFWCLRAPVCLCHIFKSWWPLFTAVRLLQMITSALSHILLEDPIIFYTSVRIFIIPYALSLVLNYINYYSVALILRLIDVSVRECIDTKQSISFLNLSAAHV